MANSNVWRSIGLTALAAAVIVSLPPWAKAIRERIITRQMPPWHIDKTSAFRSFAQLSPPEISPPKNE